MGYWWAINSLVFYSKWDSKSKILHIWKVYTFVHVEFLFSSNFDAICFSELIDPSTLCIPYWETTFQIIQVYRFIYSKVTYQYWIKLEIKTSCHNENNDHVTSEYHMYIVNFMLIFFLNSFVVHIFASKLIMCYFCYCMFQISFVPDLNYNGLCFHKPFFTPCHKRSCT